MGLIYAEIELINEGDVEMVRRGYMDKDEIRRINVSALVDTGAIMMVINENIQEYLQLPVVGKQRAELADGSIIECDIVSPLAMRFRNRATTCRALVAPGNSEPLLGAIPMEDLDVIIHPQRQEMIVNPDHPDMAQTKIKKFIPCEAQDDPSLAA